MSPPGSSHQTSTALQTSCQSGEQTSGPREGGAGPGGGASWRAGSKEAGLGGGGPWRGFEREGRRGGGGGASGPGRRTSGGSREGGQEGRTHTATLRVSRGRGRQRSADGGVRAGAAWRGGEAAAAEGSGRAAGLGGRGLTVPALPHTCCHTGTDRAGGRVPGGAGARAGSDPSGALRGAWGACSGGGGIRCRPGDALRGCGRSWHPGAGARSMVSVVVVVACGLLPPSCSRRQNAASPGSTTEVVFLWEPVVVLALFLRLLGSLKEEGGGPSRDSGFLLQIVQQAPLSQSKSAVCASPVHTLKPQFVLSSFSILSWFIC